MKPGADLRRWLENWKAVEEVEREETARERISPADAVARGFELVNVAARIHGWPLPADEADRRDEELARERWTTLKRRLRRA